MEDELHLYDLLEDFMEDIHSMQQSEEEPKELFTTSFTSSANESASGKNSGIAVQPSTVAYACQEPRQLEQHHLNPQWPDLQYEIQISPPAWDTGTVSPSSSSSHHLIPDSEQQINPPAQPNHCQDFELLSQLATYSMSHPPASSPELITILLEDTVSSTSSLLTPSKSSLNCYPPQPVLKGVKKEVKVVYSINPLNFYCQLEENSRLFSCLAEKLNATYADGSKKIVVCQRLGLPCVVKHPLLNSWYRAKIVRDGGPKTAVMLVDYGRVWDVDRNLVKEIEEEFVVLPPQAYCCTLDGVQISTSWTYENRHRFERATAGKMLIAKFAMRRKGNAYPVVLTEELANGLTLDVNKLFALSVLSSSIAQAGAKSVKNPNKGSRRQRQQQPSPNFQSSISRPSALLAGGSTEISKPSTSPIEQPSTATARAPNTIEVPVHRPITNLRQGKSKFVKLPSSQHKAPSSRSSVGTNPVAAIPVINLTTPDIVEPRRSSEKSRQHKPDQTTSSTTVAGPSYRTYGKTSSRNKENNSLKRNYVESFNESDWMNSDFTSAIHSSDSASSPSPAQLSDPLAESVANTSVFHQVTSTSVPVDSQDNIQIEPETSCSRTTPYVRSKKLRIEESTAMGMERSRSVSEGSEIEVLWTPLPDSNPDNSFDYPALSRTPGQGRVATDLKFRCPYVAQQLNLVTSRVEDAIVDKNDNSLRKFGDAILQYRIHFVKSFEDSLDSAKIAIENSQTEIERVVSVAEKHWLITPNILERWIGFKQAESSMMDYLSQVEGVTFLTNVIQLKRELASLNQKYALVFYVPAMDEWSTDVMKVLIDYVNPFTVDSELDFWNHSSDVSWYLDENRRELILDKVCGFSRHVMSNQSEQRKFYIVVDSSGGNLSGHFSIYQGEAIVTRRLKHLPRPPERLRMIQSDASRGTRENSLVYIEWDYEEVDYPYKFIVKCRTKGSSRIFEKQRANSVVNFDSPSELEVWIAMDTCIGRSEFSPVFLVPAVQEPQRTEVDSGLLAPNGDGSQEDVDDNQNSSNSQDDVAALKSCEEMLKETSPEKSVTSDDIVILPVCKSNGIKISKRNSKGKLQSMNLPSGQFATNCNKCKVTCIIGAIDEKPTTCCSFCPEQCSWYNHSSNCTVYKWYEHVEKPPLRKSITRKVKLEC